MQLGLNVLEAANGEEALDIIARDYSRLSAVFLDLKMPVLDGWRTTAQLR